MIKPTVGRVVLFTPQNGDIRFGDYKPPFAADVVYVWSDTCVNLMVKHPEGYTIIAETSVQLIQDDALQQAWGRYCEWMPYQKGQAAKTEALENLTKGTAIDPGAAA